MTHNRIVAFLEGAKPSFKCRDIRADCRFEATAAYEKELMVETYSFAKEKHNMAQIPQEVIDTWSRKPLRNDRRATISFFHFFQGLSRFTCLMLSSRISQAMSSSSSSMFNGGMYLIDDRPAPNNARPFLRATSSTLFLASG